MSSGESENPGGQPSITTPTALQWDSPKVFIRKSVPKLLDMKDSPPHLLFLSITLIQKVGVVNLLLYALMLLVASLKFFLL
jgi:hypothetical protein